MKQFKSIIIKVFISFVLLFSLLFASCSQVTDEKSVEEESFLVTDLASSRSVSEGGYVKGD